MKRDKPKDKDRDLSEPTAADLVTKPGDEIDTLAWDGTQVVPVYLTPDAVVTAAFVPVFLGYNSAVPEPEAVMIVPEPLPLPPPPDPEVRVQLGDHVVQAGPAPIEAVLRLVDELAMACCSGQTPQLADIRALRDKIAALG